MKTEVSDSFKIVVLRACVKQLVRGLDNLRWDLDHDICCLSQYEKESEMLKQELKEKKEELRQLEAIKTIKPCR